MVAKFVSNTAIINAPELLKNYRSPNGGQDGGVQAGFVLRNSEIGKSRFSIMPLMIVRACNNGMIVYNDAKEDVHLGRKRGLDIDYKDDTVELQMKTLFSEIRDLAGYFTSEEYLQKQIERMTDIGAKPLEHPIDAIKNIARFMKMSEDEEKSLLETFIMSGDHSRFGAVQALTWQAQQVEVYDTQIEYEKSAMSILENMVTFDKELVIN
jgi:hypothetical protein